MFSEKIDARLFEKISIQSAENTEMSVVIMLSNVNKISQQYNINYINVFPSLNCIVAKLKRKEIFNLANCNSVKYISSDGLVSSQIYESKKFIGIGDVYSEFGNNNNHTCVIIDTGVYPHIDFCLGRNRIVKFVDMVNGRKDMYDDNGHGTFVTGIVCGNSITSKYSGIDNKSNIIVIKALDNNGETTTSKILEAMQWVLDNKELYNIKVVCMSFGSVVDSASDPLIRGAEILWDNGIVVVAAAGNGGPMMRTIMSPGASRKIITVGSLASVYSGNISVADFSSRGPVFDYYKPDMLLPGVDIISTNIYHKDRKFYTVMSGTSVSTPMVVGVASLLFSTNENYTPDQIKYMLITSCVRITGDRDIEGYGWLDLRKLGIIK